MRRQARITLSAAGIAAVAIAGCGSSDTSKMIGTSSSRRPFAGMVIPALVVREPLGVGAFVRLRIKGRQFMFKVDTGAGRTVVDATVVKALSLPKRGTAVSASTFGCTTSVQPVAVSDWKLGDVTLPATTVASTKTELAGRKLNGTPVVGLLGSDVLSRFGTVTLDFAGKRLILGETPPSGGQSIPINVEHRQHERIFETVQAAIRGKLGGYIIDTGAPVTLIDARTSTQLGLRVLGRSLEAYGAAGCSATVTPVRINDWTAGGVKLPTTVGFSSRSSVLDKFEKGARIVGLLGANVLSTFGEVTIDFGGSRMVLGGVTG